MIGISQISDLVRLVGRWGNGDTDIDELRIDAATNTLQTIEYEHHEIHSGSSFSVHIDNTTANSDDDRTLIGYRIDWI